MSKRVQAKRAVPARSKTLWEKASDLIGADMSRSLPADASTVKIIVAGHAHPELRRKLTKHADQSKGAAV